MAAVISALAYLVLTWSTIIGPALIVGYVAALLIRRLWKGWL